MGAGRRALSPLISAGILISIAVVGGLVLYNYFYKAMGSVSTVSSVAFNARAVVVGNDTIIHYEVWNTGTSRIVLNSISILSSSGANYTVALGGITVEAGGKASGNINLGVPLDSGATYVGILGYNMGGKALETDPVPIEVSQ